MGAGLFGADAYKKYNSESSSVAFFCCLIAASGGTNTDLPEYGMTAQLDKNVPRGAETQITMQLAKLARGNLSLN